MSGKWEPSESDIEWTKQLISRVAEGCVWGTSYGVYHFDKENKILRRTMKITIDVFGAGEDLCAVDINHDRMKAVFEKLGWTVEDRRST